MKFTAVVCQLVLLATTAKADCVSDADCTVGGDPKCVKESPYYSACVDCAPGSFSQQCIYLSSQFLLAAEDTCGQSCNGRCPSGLDSQCSNSTTGSTCVQTTDGDQCVDCSDQVRSRSLFHNTVFAYWRLLMIVRGCCSLLNKILLVLATRLYIYILSNDMAWVAVSFAHRRRSTRSATTTLPTG